MVYLNNIICEIFKQLNASFSDIFIERHDVCYEIP